MASFGIVPSLKPSTRKSRPFFASGVFDVRLAVGVDDDAAGGVHGLGEVDGQALVLLELAGVAADMPLASGSSLTFWQAAFISAQVFGRLLTPACFSRSLR